MRWGVWLWCCLFGLLGCKTETPINDEQDEEIIVEDPILAKVYGKQLKLSDIPIVSAASVNDKDSVQMILKAVDHWIKEELFLSEATKNIPEDLDIERLVKEYRSSLIRHYFEEKLIQTKLDTVITEFDMKAHNEANKSLYALEKSILRCLYIKVKKPVRNAKKLEKWLEKPRDKELASLRRYCMNNAEFCLVNPEKWYQWDDIKPSFPVKFKMSDLKTGTRTTFADFKHQYYIHILEYVSKKNDAPFSYIEERANKLIIRERKNRLLNELKEQLYEEQKDTRNVEVFVK